MATVFTMPGKLGDAILQWPVAYHWARLNKEKFTVWADPGTCKPLEPLWRSQPMVEDVVWKDGIEGYNCGGQPWHFNLKTEDVVGNTVYHLGLRGFPVRQITLETLANCKVPLDIDPDTLACDVAFVMPPKNPANRLVLHGMAVYPHTKSTPGFWKFLHSVADELSGMFDDIVWTGTARDREVGKRAYPQWAEYDDGGDFKKLADLIWDSRLMIGCGSAPVALAGALKVPAIRVHDPIGEHPRVIWSNLGPNQMNETEPELRKLWPAFRDEHVPRTVLKGYEPVGP